MSLIMQPIQAEGGFGVPAGRGPVRSSFSNHFEKRLEEVITRGSDKFGVKSRDTEFEADKERLSRKEKDEVSGNEKAAAILSLFLQDLQEVAGRKDLGPGEWEAEVTDIEVLKKLALDAGMSEGQLGGILEQGRGNRLNVTSVLANLERHLGNFEEGRITVPETRLPFLESLLTKMGMDVSGIKELAADAVTGENKLDIAAFLQGLRDIDLKSLQGGTGGSVKLSQWELRQLYDLLAEAGVSRSLRNKELPELNLKPLLNQGKGSDNSGIPFSFERLKATLEAGIDNVRDRRPEINVPKFMIDLEKVLGQAKFNGKSTGWSNVIQETVDSLFKDIGKMVDMSRIQVQKGRENDDGLLLNGAMGRGAGFNNGKGEILGRKFEFQPDISTSSSGKEFLNPDFILPKQGDRALTTQSVIQDGRLANRFPRHIQDRIMQQISSGVMRGLDNGRHSLLLRLHPPELGEVKVSLQVRNDHVSVSFNMENAKVKEILEGNMQNFKDSMGQRGFSLDECTVFVGQEGASGKREEFGNFFKSGTTGIAAAGEDESVPPGFYYPEGAPGIDGEKDGISLIV